MFQELKINGTALPRPDGDLEFKNEKMTTEYETEAGTTQVLVRRASRLSVSGTWTVTGKWVQQFRTWEEADTVTVSAYFPSRNVMSDHECQLSIESEKHIRGARAQLDTDGLYEIGVTMEEL